MDFVRSVPEFATCEAQFEPVCGRSFDGACRIDVIVRVRPGFAAAFELKLGATRLTKARINDDWLRPCTPSHGDQRWRGNVMAVLDRRFANATGYALTVRASNERLELIPWWFIVARRRVLEAWKNHPPNFSSAARQIAFEDVVARFGGAGSFNRLVREKLDIDYFNEWVDRDPVAG